MKKSMQMFAIFCLALPLLACAALSQTVTPASLPTVQPTVIDLPETPFELDAYDPSRDPAADLQTAIGVAQKEHKRILLEIGGEWCVWCHIMDKFYEDHPALLKLRKDHYVLIKVNYSEENQNAAFLGQYPEIAGYPHVFVLESDGSLLHSQNTGELEEGKSYNLEKFTSFLATWVKP